MALFVLVVQSVLPFGAARAEDIQAANPEQHLLIATDEQGLNSEALSKQILLKEIELERFNIHYSLETSKSSRWKHWRYFCLQEADASLTDAGFITVLSERAKHIRSPQKICLHTIETGVVVRTIAPWFGIAASTSELGLDFWRDHQLSKLGFSPAAAKAHVITLRHEIDQLIKDRDALLQQEQASNTQGADMEMAEGEVLKDIRDLSLVEFERFHIGSRRYRAFEKCLYLLDITNNSILAAVNLVSLEAVRKRQAKLDGPVGALAVVYGSIGVLTPVVALSLRKLVGDYDKRSLAACTGGLQTREVTKLDADRDRLRQLCQAHDKENMDTACGTIARLGMYESHSKTFRDQLATAQKEIRAGNRAATMNLIAGSIVGGSIIGAGAVIATAGYHYPTNARRFNTLVAAGTTAVVGGVSIVVLDNVRIQVQNEINRHRLARKGLLPAQALTARLKQLDEIESTLKKTPTRS